MGVGEGIGSDGPGGRGRKEEERESGEGREEVRTGGFLFLFCLNKRLRGFLSLLGFLDGRCLVYARSLSLL
jgi:hypothetical protein